MILLIHAMSCLFMTGAIWLIQVLVYPNFRLIGSAEFGSFHAFHMKRITYVVAPVMFLELLTGLWLLVQAPSLLCLLNMASIVSLWLMTGLVNVPAHKKLSFEDVHSKQRLVVCNWPRTILWSARSLALSIFIFAQTDWTLQ